MAVGLTVKGNAVDGEIHARLADRLARVRVYACAAGKRHMVNVPARGLLS